MVDKENSCSRDVKMLPGHLFIDDIIFQNILLKIKRHGTSSHTWHARQVRHSFYVILLHLRVHY